MAGYVVNLTFYLYLYHITIYGASSGADGSENHLAWRISKNNIKYAAVDVRHAVVLALGACHIEWTSDLEQMLRLGSRDSYLRNSNETWDPLTN
jgi:hypothetical protein